MARRKASSPPSGESAPRRRRLLRGVRPRSSSEDDVVFTPAPARFRRNGRDFHPLLLRRSRTSRIALSGRVCFIAPFVSIGGFGRPGADYPCAGPC
ncbi:uncharacterized protein ATNIH1004_002045 [Aspergillus tanneri]|uniref:Uncharacterized protein n=1 Tax=Aspergillus tanneri TaxID=1220188 RepID=A0A5M9M2V2_9EURO|nr:uncharacterized protein ATNIH1004_002045 [Aspergillus tanneri]KAA8641305.1 hypothetical protein ATNIH1004_002045 [Aspergillus tanneri]